MTPVLLDRYSLTPVGVLDDCISCTVYEEINGVFECQFQYPMSGPYYEYLINYGGSVMAQFNQTQTDYFDIYSYSAPIDGIVTFNACHVSYRLANLVVEGGWTATDPDDALAKIAANAVTPNEFTFSTVTQTWDSGTLDVSGFANARALLLGREGESSCVTTWSCEFIFRYFNVSVRPKRGDERGVEIRYGKNMTNIVREKDNGGIISSVFPYWHDASFENYVTGRQVYSTKFEYGLTPWTVEQTIDEPDPTVVTVPMRNEDGVVLEFTPAIINASAVDFSDKFQNQPTTAQLEKAAADYMRKNSTWRSNDNITVDMIDLYGTPEYEDIKELARCNIGDFVNVYYPALGVVARKVEIVSATFDTLAERYTQMQLGTLRTTLAQVIIDSIGGNYQ